MFENVSRRNFLQGSAVLAAGLGLAGCSGDGGGDASSDGSTIKVGILGPHTGDVANYGIACRNGAQLYFDQLNADGGINGKQVEYLVEDEQGDPTQAGQQGGAQGDQGGQYYDADYKVVDDDDQNK